MKVTFVVRKIREVYRVNGRSLGLQLWDDSGPVAVINHCQAGKVKIEQPVTVIIRDSYFDFVEVPYYVR